MPRVDASPALNYSAGRAFQSTHWTAIRACAVDDQTGRAARERLCRDYWYPLYVYIKRTGSQADDDAEDQVQEFFAHILNRPWFDRADQTKGRFRSFLLISLERFLRDRAAGKKALKRGGAFRFVSLEAGDGSRSDLPPGDGVGVAPAEIYEVEWANAVVSTTLVRLEKRYADLGKADLYHRLKIYLATEGDAASYTAAAEALGTSAGTIKVGVSRLRKEYGGMLREEVARTVAAPEDVEGEMRHMRAILAAS